MKKFKSKSEAKRIAIQIGKPVMVYKCEHNVEHYYPPKRSGDPTCFICLRKAMTGE